MQSDTEIQEWWRDRGGEERAPDKRGGKGQPPLQVVPCSGEEEEEGRKKNRKEKRWQRRREREWVSSGRVRRRKEQWPIERRGNCLAKAIQHKQENSPCIEAGGDLVDVRGRGRGHSMAVPQDNRLGRQEEGAVVPLILLLPLYSCAGLRLASLLSSPSPLHPPPWASSLQVELLGSDMLQLLPQHAEGGPHHGVQGPALLHQVVHNGRAAVWGVHLVSLLYPGHHLFQRLRDRHRFSKITCYVTQLHHIIPGTNYSSLQQINKYK